MLEAGTYYVGDLCYVLGDKNGWNWGELLAATGYLGIEDPVTGERLDKDETTGYFRHRGVKLFSSGTAYGDGSYRDQSGREYLVDAGLIGCFPMDALGVDPKMDVDPGDGGHVVEFKMAFSCQVCDEYGVIRIGHIKIDTNPSYEDEECWECGSYCCEGDCNDDEE
jgi:hypothetical protein